MTAFGDQKVVPVLQSRKPQLWPNPNGLAAWCCALHKVWVAGMEWGDPSGCKS